MALSIHPTADAPAYQSPPSADDRYRFVIFPSARAGMIIFEHVAERHPQLFVPAHGLVDRAVASGDLTGFAARSPGKADIYLPRWGQYCPGLLIHSWHAGTPRERFETIFQNYTDQRLLLQLVREPRAAVAAQQNAYLRSTFWNYFLAAVSSGPHAPAPTIREPAALFESNAFGPMYHRVHQLYGKLFDTWHVIDFSELMPDRFPDTLRRAYDLIGVEDYYEESFEYTYGSSFSGFMNRFILGVDIGGLQVEARLFPVKEGLPLPKGFGHFDCLVAQTGSVADRIEVTAPDLPMGLFVAAQSWFNVPGKLRTWWVESGEAAEVLEQQFLPAFLAIAERTVEAARPHLLSAEDPRVTVLFDAEAQAGIDDFLERFPHVAALWGY